jgi:hypothetical protein
MQRSVCCLAILVCALTSCVRLTAQDLLPREYQIKAVFLFNFTQFVEWPSTAFAAPNSPLVIGILGEDPFGSYLDETVKDEVVDNHPLVVERFASAKDIRVCHILFINLKEKDDIRQALDDLKSQPILTVSDLDTFLRTGGMIRFFTENSRIRIRINVDRTTEENLTISSKLLRLAEIFSQKNN